MREKLVVVGVALCALPVFAPAASAENHLPSGFRDQDAISGLTEPTSVRFASNGEVFVAEKSGEILVFESLSDATPTVFADLRTNVYNGSDRGLLGIELDPQFSSGRPFVYVIYSYDHELGSSDPAPRWGEPGQDGDPCPEPPGANTGGCVISGRVARLTADGEHAVEEGGEPLERVLVEGWCQQFSSHSIGDLAFTSSGDLLASGGDGASFENTDYGQFGFPQANPCGDPPGGVGGIQTPPTAEGGALRSQNFKKLNGSLIRIDPETGEGVPGNPLASSTDSVERQLVGKGFRNPFRFTIDPTTGQYFVANVGDSRFEEIDVLDPNSPAVYNSGWPCWEAFEHRFNYEEAGLNVCKSLYSDPSSLSQPFYYYPHGAGVTPEDPCPSESGSAISGLDFYEGGSYPQKYDGALFFADSVRGCIYVMRTDSDGDLDPSTVEPFLTEGGEYPGVDVEIGPGGDLYYVSLYRHGSAEGILHRITYDPDAPEAKLSADRTSGALPLEVHFDAGESSDPQGDPLTYEWDLDGDGTFGPPSTDPTQTETYVTAENRTAAVRVSDPGGHRSVAQLAVYPGDTPPVPTIETPAGSLKWHVGQEISFSGSATEGGGGAVPAKRLYWRTRLDHCPLSASSCHSHPLEVFTAVHAGSLIAPSHDYPSYIEFTLTATDSRGLSASRTIKLEPTTVDLDLQSDPPGVPLIAGLVEANSPFTAKAITGANVSLSAPETFTTAAGTYVFSGWSDGGARVHSIVAAASGTFKATYKAPPSPPKEKPKEQPPVDPSPAPTIRLKSHPPKKTTSARARFAFSSNRPDAKFECSYEGSRYGICSSPWIIKRVKQGNHAFRVHAWVDPGDLKSANATYRWRRVAKAKR